MNLANYSILRNPAESALATIQWGNPLQANYGDTIAQASGQDDARTILGAATEVATIGALPSSEPTGAWLLHGLGLRDTAYQETGLFIVGAIVLAIGIFALTR